jgi:hypothetical protein
LPHRCHRTALCPTRIVSRGDVKKYWLPLAFLFITKMLLPQQVPPPMPVLSPEFLAEDHGTRIIIVTAVITGVSFLVVFLRVYVRAVMLKTVESDDFTVSKHF